MKNAILLEGDSIECVDCDEPTRTTPCEHCGHDPVGTDESQERCKVRRANGEKVLDEMGHGMRLRISHEGAAEIVKDPKSFAYGSACGPWVAFCENHPVDADTVRFLLNSWMIYKLSEYRDNGKIGWREAGMDGEKADWYCLTL